MQRGFSFVEVLVTVFVCAVGLLGTASLIANSMKFNHDSYLRSTATAQAYSIADRIRANPTGMAAGLYNNVAGIGTDPGCTSNCTSAQIAQKDVFDWNTANGNTLPSGQGTVVAAGGGIFNITVMYDARRTGATGTACGPNPAVDLTCLTVSVQIE